MPQIVSNTKKTKLKLKNLMTLGRAQHSDNAYQFNNLQSYSIYNGLYIIFQQNNPG